MASRLRMRGLLVAALLALPGGAAAQAPMAQAIARTEVSVAQVIGRDCQNGDRTGTGFVWRQADHLVTALHVVANCGSLAAFFQERGEIGARLERALPAMDLALLKLERDPGREPLRAAARVPEVEQRLQVIGYALGVPTRDSRPLTVTSANRNAFRLQDALPVNLQSSVRQNGQLSLDTEILRLDGNLLPGHSGAPLIDGAGEVVGIGSGGLESGAVGVGWAIRARYLEALASAPEAHALRLAAAPRGFFALTEPKPQGGAERRRCGQLDFVRLRTRTLQELVQSSDDPLGLQQIAMTSGLPSDELDRMRFEVWTQPDSGGGVALPEGMRLESEGEDCRAVDPSGQLEVRIVAARHADAYQAQAAALAFEAQLVAELGPYWQQDPTFSYWTPKARPDGMIDNRKTVYGFDQAGPAAAIFETLMAHKGVFIGAAAVNRAYRPAIYQQCAAYPGAPQCGEVLRFYRAWAAAAFGVHLSTFPAS